MLLRLGSNTEDLDKAAELLDRGQLVVLPTETVYGLGASLAKTQSLKNIFKVKGRPSKHPLIVHFHALEQLEELTENPPPQLYDLAEKFWPGPLTIVVPKHPCVSKIVTGGQDNIAVRLSAHPVLQGILERRNLTLAAPSANLFGQLSPTAAAHVDGSILKQVAALVDGGACQHGIESTLIYLDAHRSLLLRRGPVDPAAIEAVLKQPLKLPPATHLPAPGSFHRHYCPQKPLYLYDKLPDKLPDKAAKIHLKRPLKPKSHDYWLSAEGQLEQVAHRLYSVLWQVDQDDRYTTLHLEQAEDTSFLGSAINERLKKAGKG